MNKINKIIKILIVVAIIAIGVILINKTRTFGKITVENWDNIYNRE